jgi:hypothetical protein
MARTMHADAAETWRTLVTVTRTTADGGEHVWSFVAGPFVSRRSASAAITREQRSYRYSPLPVVVTGIVQRAALVWEDVQ